MGIPQGFTSTSASDSAKARNSARRRIRNPKLLPVSSHPDADPETVPTVGTEPPKSKPEPIVSINGADVDPDENSRAA
jgi:hypothetical protein